MCSTKFFPQDHYGFIPTCDCTLTVTTFLHDIATTRSCNQFVAAICVDIKAAYDSVNPDILIYKLPSYGIRGKTGRWIENFIKNRCIRIQWKHLTSCSAPCFQSVPQGTVLSPFLFFLYMLDAGEVLESGVFMIIYSDDIVLYAIGDNEDLARHKLQTTLFRVHIWCQSNCLSIEPA